MDNLSDIIARVKTYEPLWDGWHCTDTLLGSGGSGCVLLLGRRAERSVVKVICIEDDESKYNMVKNEIETMLNLSGKYLVECLDCRTEQVFNHRGERLGFDFLIHMHEYVPLSDYLKEEEYDPAELCRRLVLDIGLALGTLHSKGVLHRDIKPENIFIDYSKENPHFRLGDFGVSKKMNDMSGLTSVGTPNYMAPESSQKFDYDYRTDIYSFGIMLYYILNDLQFPRFTNGQSQQDLWNDNIRRLSGERIAPPKFGDETLKKVVLKCCEAKPRDRYQDVSELLNELFGENYYVKFGVKLKKEKSEIRKREDKKNRIRRTVIALSVIVTTAAIITAVILGIHLNKQPSVSESDRMINTATVEEVTSDPKLSIYTSDFIDLKVSELSRAAEEVTKSYPNSSLFYKGYLYLKKGDNTTNWETYTHYTGFCFDDKGKVFYIRRVKAGETVQLFIYDNDIICAKVKAIPNSYTYTYGDPNITEEMKAKITEAYEEYQQYQQE